MEKLYIIILSVLFSALVGMVGYWIKAVHRDFKQILKELTEYTNELKQLIVGIQTHISKGIESDIVEIKTDIKNLYNKTGKNENSIASIEQKIEKK